MITISNLAKAFGSQTLFSKVSLQLTAGRRYGLVGANGSGKTTFLRLLAEAEEASEGTISRPRRLRLGLLSQEHFRYESVPILDVAMMGHEQLWRALVDKDELLARADQSFDGERYAELEDVILSLDGYSFEARAGAILEGLGIPGELHRKPLSVLSGGFKLRVLLARVLASDPECLLLDEPTNHLDILSIRWLERFLGDYPGCLVVISHDHRFLDNVCSHILDVDYETITLYSGNYTAFVAGKQAERERKEAEITKRSKQIADRQAFVDRFRAKATKARQAQSKLKQIERIVIEPLPLSSRRHPTFRFSQCRPSGKMALEVEGLSKSYGTNKVLDQVSLHVRRGDRLAIIGPNGIGKSTLLKILVGRLTADAGRVTWGHETYPGYFAQDHHELLKEESKTVQDWLWDACPGENIGFVRSHLGQVLFSRQEVEKKLANLSGGEATRLVLARLALEHPNVMVLDEPTNHLDLEAIEALVAGIQGYDGTVLLVSHDRWFVSLLATRIVEITATGINDFGGSYDDYVASCGDDHLDTESVTLRARREKRKKGAAAEADAANSARTGTDSGNGERTQADAATGVRSGARSSAEARRRKELARRRDQVTAEIEQAEARVEEINRQFCQAGFFDATTAGRVRNLEVELKGLTNRIAELMREWEGLEAEITGDAG